MVIKGTVSCFVACILQFCMKLLSLFFQVKRMAFKCKCQEYVNRISEGVYDVFGKRVFIRVSKILKQKDLC